ncbi:hypothetical protein MTR67_030582 [Solanum verrucosum]|uniref:Uncharacterized protein n=1 Tax=Solanum verrucosum TaxID=315347 RepID=A0AAF0R692_SOLVR|nr:hypothetical protein MTR67_030582 [Solanum verrucosum]
MLLSTRKEDAKIPTLATQLIVGNLNSVDYDMRVDQDLQSDQRDKDLANKLTYNKNDKPRHIEFEEASVELCSLPESFEWRSFNEVTDYVKKVEGVRPDGQAKALAKWPRFQATFKVLIPEVQGGQRLQSRQFILPCLPLQVENVEEVGQEKMVQAETTCIPPIDLVLALQIMSFLKGLVGPKVLPSV